MARETLRGVPEEALRVVFAPISLSCLGVSCKALLCVLASSFEETCRSNADEQLTNELVEGQVTELDSTT